MQLTKTGLVLPGGGSRAAYQVGVVKALAEITRGREKHPFPILCGTSAGAINAVALASKAQDFSQAAIWLEQLWRRLEMEHVYRTDWFGLMRNAQRLIASLFNAGVATGRPVALLDNLPLKQLLRAELQMGQISQHIADGHLEGISVTAMNYTENCSVSFFQGGPKNAGWSRWRRQGIPSPLQLRHVLASTAIPMIFPPQRIGRNYYGDGALRQMAPISPALHLGAERVLVVPASGHHKHYSRPAKRIHSPALGQVIGHLLNSAFVDSLETDIEMLERINELLRLLPPEAQEKTERPLRPVDIFIISPSEDIDTLAEEHVHELPRSLRALLKITGSGSYEGGVNIASYLLFTVPFCEKLIDMGYRDAMNLREEIIDFLPDL